MPHCVAIAHLFVDSLRQVVPATWANVIGKYYE